MRKYSPVLIVFITLAVLALLLTGCGAEEAVEEPAVQDTATVAVVAEATQTEETIEEPTAEPEPSPTVIEEAEETEDVEEEEEEPVEAAPEEVANQCMECHGDMDRLIDTADPVEEVESENEGAG